MPNSKAPAAIAAAWRRAACIARRTRASEVRSSLCLQQTVQNLKLEGVDLNWGGSDRPVTAKFETRKCK
eukprot:751046-Hanusia_phi.AAC.1